MMELNLLDVCIIAITAISAVIGMFRGMTKESITLITWVLAGILGIKYGAVVGAMFDSVTTTEMVKKLIGGSLIVIGVLIIGAVVNAILSKFVKISNFVIIDKVLGIGFGVLRSLVIFLIAITLVDNIFVSESWWKESTLLPKLQIMTENVKSSLPQDWVQSYTEFTNNLKA